MREQRALHDFADASSGVGRWYVLQRKTGATGLANAIIDPFDACASAGDGDMSAGGGALIDPRVTALWGRVHDASELASGWQDEDLSNANNHSVVLRIDFGAASVLLTGDLEEVGIAALIAQYAGSGLLDVDVYKAGHHGSYNGTTAALVNAMSPRAAVISAGPAARFGDWTAWEYGHPRWPAVSDLLGDGDSDGVSAARPDPIDALVAIDYAQGRGPSGLRLEATACSRAGTSRRPCIARAGRARRSPSRCAPMGPSSCRTDGRRGRDAQAMARRSGDGEALESAMNRVGGAV